MQKSGWNPGRRRKDRIARFGHGAIRSDMPLVLRNRPAEAYQVRATRQSFDLNSAVNPSVRCVAVGNRGVTPTA